MKGFFSWMHRLVKSGLYIILLTPLFAWRGFLFPQLTGKVLGFQFIVDVVLAAALLMCLLSMWRVEAADRARFAVSGLTASVAAFLGFSVLAATWGIDPSRSFWGSNDRQDGLVLWLHFFAWYVILVAFYRGDSLCKPSMGAAKKSPRARNGTTCSFASYLQFSFWVSVAVASTALAELIITWFGGTVPFEIRSIIPARVSGLFGNPVALGPYLLFHVFFGIYYAYSVAKGTADAAGLHEAPTTARRRGKSIILATAIALADLIPLSVIMLGQTRGVALGFVISLGALALAAAFNKKSVAKMRIAVIACLLLGIVLGLAVWQLRDRLAAVPVISRLFLLKESQSTVMRQLTWRSALEGFPDHPLTGWGHDNVYYALNKYYDPNHISFNPSFDESRLTWYDKSHNAYLDLLVEKGILGGILFFLVLFFVAKELRSVKDRMMAACLAGGILAYLISNAVAFDSFGSLFGLFLFLSWLEISRNMDTQSELARHTEGDTSARKDFPCIEVFCGVGAVVVLMAAILSAYASISCGIANAKCLKAQNLIEQNNPTAAMASYKATFTLFFPYNFMEKLNCATSILNMMIHNKPVSDPHSAISFATQLTREALAAHPQDVAIYMNINDFYNNLALYGDVRFVEEAEAAGRKALELSPRRQEVKFILGRTLIAANKPLEAVKLNHQMITDGPDFALAHWLLGLSLIAADQRDEARGEIAKAIKMGYKLQKAKEVEAIKQYFGDNEFTSSLQRP